ncbi:carboxymuconolactone decarboxylase family protein [Engelhardtia mirabilis]|uniref:Carboxymuconolactone decarboxylase family protein n=1 Tax=Engelhardtia mirabilis TaxID=2528011 RepID=A0A518BJ30_9BACT|nr:Carboxymuconolactone decarboxylase family protein [Planctomycetes bacterium Pla133]QDV01301.1 Carboxymuconolactone decarboxylase family protein [Planctomycetes bacterium Pla86]
MAWIRTVSDDEAQGFLARQFAAARARAGRVFGIVRLMSLQPRTLDASMGLYQAVMFGSGGLARRQREMLAVVVSRANQCHY